MGHERWFRGQHDGQERPFDWLTAARQHGIPDKLARTLYEQAMQQAHGATQDRVQELYLALVASTLRDSARPSPGKVTRTMRLQAARIGKRRRPYISRLTGQQIAPGKRTLTSYLELAVHESRGKVNERTLLEDDAASNRAVNTTVPADLQDAMAPTRSRDDQVQLGKTRAVPSGVTRPSTQDIMAPGTTAHRQLQANLAAAFGHLEELEALEEEGISPSPMTIMEASPMDTDGEDFIDAAVNGWSLSPEAQLTREWQLRGRLTSAWTVQLDDSWPETSPERAQSSAWGEPYQMQLADREIGLLPLMAIPGRQVESWGAAGPIQAAGLQGIPEVPVRLPGHGGGTEMPEEVRANMEAAFGVDFSEVRIHEGPHVEAVGALAYTQGTDIHFAPGQYQPTSSRGRELLGHELAHVVQQFHGRVQTMTYAYGVNINNDVSLEREADAMGARAAQGTAGGELSVGASVPQDRTEQEFERLSRGLPREGESTVGSVAPPIRKSHSPAIVRQVAGADAIQSFNDLWTAFSISRVTAPIDARALAPEVARRMTERADIIAHGVDLVTYLVEAGLTSEANSLLPRLEESWRESARAGSSVGAPPAHHAPHGARDVSTLILQGSEAARRSEHEEAYRMLGLAYYILQVQMHGHSRMRSATMAARRGLPLGAPDVYERSMSYITGRSAYDWMREILDVYPSLEREARIAGDADQAARMAQFGRSLREDIHRNWTLTGAHLMIAEVEPTTTPRGPGLTLHGVNAEVIDLLELPGMPPPAELEAGTYQQEGAEGISAALCAQVSLVTELMAYPEIRAEFGEQDPDLRNEAHRLRAWQVMYRVFHGEVGFAALHRLMSLIGRWLSAYTVHTGYNIRDWGRSYLDTPLPTDLLGRIEMDCGVYALTVAWEVYQVARTTQPRLNLDFEILATPNHMQLIIKDTDRNEGYLVNNNTISPPRSGDLLDEAANAMGQGYLATWAFRLPLGSTRQAPSVFRRGLWENYLDAANVGLGPEPDQNDGRTEADRYEDAHRHFFERQALFDSAARTLRAHLQETRSAVAASSDQARELTARLTRLQDAATALLQLFRELAVEPTPGLILYDRAHRQRHLRRVGQQVYLFTSETPGEPHPLVRFAQALLYLEAIDGIPPAGAQQYIRDVDTLGASEGDGEPFHVELQRYREQGMPPEF